MEELMFVTRGDHVMPSVALTLSKFSAKYGRGTFGVDLFANVVVDPARKDTKNLVVYFDSDDAGKDGGNIRTLAGTPTWYIDRLIVSASGGSTAIAMGLLSKHVDFLCSVRTEPVFCEETGIWYRILHVALLGRPRRPGRTAAGQDLYEAMLRVMWRPMSAKDSDYIAVTGITS